MIVCLDRQTILAQSPHEFRTIRVVADIDALPLISAHARGDIGLERVCLRVAADRAFGYIILVDNCELLRV